MSKTNYIVISSKFLTGWHFGRIKPNIFVKKYFSLLGRLIFNIYFQYSLSIMPSPSSDLSSALIELSASPPRFNCRKYGLHLFLPASFFKRFSFARLFWNHTCTTLISRPVSALNCSRTCLAGFGLSL